MLRNHTISSSLSTSMSTAVPSTLAQSLRGMSPRRALGAKAVVERTSDGAWQLIARTLRLPDTARTFLLFSLAVTVICGGMILHLLLAISILESRIELHRLDTEYRAIRRESTTLIWAISQETTLDRVQTRAVAAGYEPTFERRYVIQPVTGAPVVPSTNVAAAAPDRDLNVNGNFDEQPLLNADSD